MSNGGALVKYSGAQGRPGRCTIYTGGLPFCRLPADEASTRLPRRQLSPIAFLRHVRFVTRLNEPHNNKWLNCWPTDRILFEQCLPFLRRHFLRFAGKQRFGRREETCRTWPHWLLVFSTTSPTSTPQAVLPNRLIHYWTTESAGALFFVLLSSWPFLLYETYVSLCPSTGCVTSPQQLCLTLMTLQWLDC